MNRILSEGFAGSAEFLLSADNSKVGLLLDARHGLLRKLRRMIEANRKMEKENQRLEEDLRKVREKYEDD